MKDYKTFFKTIILYALVHIAGTLDLVGQNINPGTDQIFRPLEVSRIYLTLTSQDKASLLDPANASSEEYVPADFRMVNSQFDITLSNQVGVRLRGNTSRYHDKKSFKIDFREFGGAKFFDYKKFNLKPNVNDPSVIREPLTLLLYREMNVPASRSHPVELYMNNEYMGIYMNIEQIDDEFLDKRYGHENGYLYKCSWGATLEDNNQVNNTSVYESEINQQTDNRAQLKYFVYMLNKVYTSNTEFQTAIEPLFNVDSYLRQLAVEAMVGHWDGYSYNKNNFYIYYNVQTQLIEFIPYDGDNTWGIDWLGVDWALRNLNTWAKTDEARPLTKRILQVPEYQEKYHKYLRLLVTNYFNSDYLNPVIDEYKNILASSVSNDTYFDNSFGFTYSTFLNSFTGSINNSHVDYGIKPYITARTEYAIQQIPGLITPVENPPSFASLYPNPSSTPAFFYSATNLMDTPRIYNSTGAKQSFFITVMDSKVQISLPPEASRGVYIVHINGELVRWIYN